MRQFIHQVTNERREEATKRLIQTLAVFIFNLQNYLTENGISVSVVHFVRRMNEIFKDYLQISEKDDTRSDSYYQ